MTLRIGRLASASIAIAMLLAACGGDTPGTGAGGSTGSTPTAGGPRPASTATLTIVSPADGQVVQGSAVDLELELQGATIVDATTSDIVPDEGHLHVILDDRLISMTSGLEQTIPDVAPGQHLLKVEFVASDHAPFEPRVIAAVSFETSG
jgi:hypothetical protein